MVMRDAFDDFVERSSGHSSRASSALSMRGGKSHGDEVQECLDVAFPPYYHSTHGLSRPSTPTDEYQDR